jgi:ABC-2 type transport system permease protein
LFAAAFLAIFALRMRTEFRGEVLSDVANAVAPLRKAKGLSTSPAAALRAQPVTSSESLESRPPGSAVGTLLAKELLYVRRNTGLLYSLIVPVIMVFLFAGKMSIRGNSTWIVPAAVAYTLLSVMPLSFNSFGLEGVGAQFYFLAPVRMRDVFLAKNLLSAALALVEIVMVLGVIVYLSGRPPVQMIVLSLLWAGATLLIGLTLGNLRSVSAPKRIEFSRAAGKQASSVSALISMGVLVVLAGFGAGLLVAARLTHLNWILLPTFAALLAVGVVVYVFGLRGVERYALDHREEMFAELSKK